MNTVNPSRADVLGQWCRRASEAADQERPVPYFTVLAQPAEYQSTDNGTATITTRVGSVATRILTQQRAGSSRVNWLWVAPELRFLPVRMEQRRDGEVQTAFELVSVDGLAANP